MARHTVPPGGRVPESGIYQGTKSGEKVTLIHGKTAPPTPKAGEKWKEIEATNPHRR